MHTYIGLTHKDLFFVKLCDTIYIVKSAIQIKRKIFYRANSNTCIFLFSLLLFISH